MAPAFYSSNSENEKWIDLQTPFKAKDRKISPLRLLIGVLTFFAGLVLLQEPLASCYERLSRTSCHANLSVEQRASRILRETPLIDGHIDLPIFIRALYGNHIEADNFTQPFQNGSFPGHLDIHRLREGQSGGAFWSVWTPCPKDGDDFSDDNYRKSVQMTLDQIDLMSRIQGKYPEVFSSKLNSDDAMKAFKQGKLISPLGVEGLHQIGNKAANLRRFHDLGVRYATLTHNCHNQYADAAIVGYPDRKSKPLWGGVSPLGRKLVHEMNRIGMIVDISHVSEDTMVDVLGGGEAWDGSKAPVIFSHSSAHSICPHPRNVKDHVLQLVKRRNSVVMVNFAPQFVSCIDNGNENGIPDFDPDHNTLADVVKHIMHIGDLIGYDHVGIGTDYDGIPTTPTGLEDVTKYPDLIAALLKEGVSDANAAKIAGGNVIRVWKEVDAVAADMQKQGAPVLEDDVPSMDMPFSFY